MLLTPLYRNTGAAHPSPRIYIWRSRANICIIHVSSVTTCLHTVQCPTIVTLTANYASITGPVSGRRKGRELGRWIQALLCPRRLLRMWSIKFCAGRMSPRVSVIARTYLVLATVPCAAFLSSDDNSCLWSRKLDQTPEIVPAAARANMQLIWFNIKTEKSSTENWNVKCHQFKTDSFANDQVFR